MKTISHDVCEKRIKEDVFYLDIIRDFISIGENGITQKVGKKIKMKIRMVNSLADVIEKGLMKMYISSSKDIGVVSNQNRASADNDLDYMQSWAFLNGNFIECCIKADVKKGVARVAQPTLKGIEYKDIHGDVNILRLDILEEGK